MNEEHDRAARDRGHLGDSPGRAGRASAVDAAIAAAQQAGLEVRQAEVLAERSNAIVALEPAGVVARVAMDVRLAARADGAARGAYAREVELARRLASLGAPVLAPTDDVPAGPHYAGGRVVSFWPRLRDARRAAPDDAGRALRACRAALDQIPDLPVLWLLSEAADLARLPAVADVLGPRAEPVARELERERAAGAGGQLVAVHGDAGLGNALEVDGKVLWIDWEDAMRAPARWDAACLAATSLVFGDDASAHAALHGLGVDPTDSDLQPLIRLRVLQTVPWSALVVARGAKGRDRLARRLAWLEAS